MTDAAEAAALWRIREDGAGLAARSLKTPAYSGWEDAAVPPDRLGAWLRDFDELLKEHGLDGVPYGHFGDGCVHVRIDFPFEPGQVGSAKVFRDFLTACALKLRDHRGSLSGEHGDGRARSELLPLMYDAESIRLFAAVKAICDPRNLLNPGNLVDPAPLDADLRPVRARQPVLPLLKLPHDGGRLGDAVHRCTGVGKCVAASTTGVMCPSYLATRDEKDSTRGRSRVLQEAIDGSLVQGFADPAVAEALDLCLACKGCASDCPTGVDMATYKSEALHQKHDVQGVRRPRSHRLLGRLPAWADRAAPVAPLANRMMRLGPVARLAKATAGIDQRRSIPAFARKTLRRSVSTSDRDGSAPDVWIWADSFSDHFFPANGHAAIRYLESAGLTARVIPDDACCGLTWITTGQLDQAQRIMARTVATLAPYVESGVPVIGLEPSCLATLRSDAAELTGSTLDVLSLAELVEREQLPVPDLTGVEVVAQPHCHHHAVIGWAADQRLLERAGATVTRVAGCCGLAGNFGMEKGHYEVSVAVAETHLLPAVRAQPHAVVLADGMSCRVQLDDLAGVPALHLAELLAQALAVAPVERDLPGLPVVLGGLPELAYAVAVAGPGDPLPRVGVDALEHHRAVLRVPVEQQHAAGRVHPRLVPAAALGVPRAEAVPHDAAVAAPVLGQGAGAVEVGDRVPADVVALRVVHLPLAEPEVEGVRDGVGDAVRGGHVVTVAPSCRPARGLTTSRDPTATTS